MTDQGHPRSPISRLVGPVREAIIHSIDPDDIVDRVDPDAILNRVDVNRLLEQVDVNRLLDRVDPDRLLDRVDPDRLMDRVDVDRLVSRVDIDGIVASSTGRVAGTLVDSIRRQLVGVDAVVVRSLERFTRPGRGPLPDGPAGLQSDTPATVGGCDVTGRYAGPLTRLAANGGDLAIGFGLFTLLSAGLGYLAALVFNVQFDPANTSGLVGTASVVMVLFTYMWLSISIAGRSPAMAVLGLRVVARDGRPRPTGRAFVRTAALPLSALFFGAGFVGLFVGRERRALHDVIGGSVVIYDWGDRPASLPTPLGDWLSRHEHAPN